MLYEVITFEPESKTIMVTMLNMYGNSRSLTRNYMATVLGNEPQMPEKDKRQILFDLISEKGLNDFDRNYPEYLKIIGMDRITSYNVCYTKLLRIAFIDLITNHIQVLAQQGNC